MATFHAQFIESGNFESHFGEVQFVKEGEWYEGDYTVAPADEMQVLPTQGKLMAENIVIDPIPQNYCRFSWNGTKLTVY